MEQPAQPPPTSVVTVPGTQGAADAVTVGVGDRDALRERLPVAVADADTAPPREREADGLLARLGDRDALTDRDALRDREGVPVAFPHAGSAGAAVAFRAHATVRFSVWLAAAVSRSVASVALAASSTRSVWLMARVSQPPAMPAAAHAAGGAQHVGEMASRLAKTTDASRVGAPRSSAQYSHALDPPEL